ncbi:MAG: response regulator [Nitrospirae bacterium]|nr:response regulator [Nitrospirota bacterium]MBI5696068.1 response regulator [Nitrospirota bacterium]
MEKRILLVDDNALSSKVIGQLLAGAGYTVEFLNSPFGIFKEIREFMPDLVLMDLDMPALKGDSLSQLLNRKLPDVEHRVVLFSAADDDVLGDAVRRAGAVGYIRKTDGHDEILEQVRLYIETGSGEGATDDAEGLHEASSGD